MKERQCDFCSAKITNPARSKPRVCGYKDDETVPKDASDCWLTNDNVIKKLCVLSLHGIAPQRKYYNEIVPLLKRLGEEYSGSNEQIREFFYTLSGEERKFIWDYIHPVLKKIFEGSIPLQDQKNQKISKSASARSCDFCDAHILQTKGHYPRSCGMQYCKAMPPEHSNCWLNQDNLIKKLCVETIKKTDPRISCVPELKMLLKKLAEECSEEPLKLGEFLKSLEPTQRYILLKYSTPELKKFIAKALTELDLATRKPMAKVYIPEDLPEGLLVVINEYKEKIERRYERLIKQKHERDANYIRHEMFEAIGFCVYLASKGFTAWEGIRNRDVVDYLASKGRMMTNPLKRFISFTEGKRNPFRKQGMQKPRRTGTVLVETPRPKIVPPTILNKFIKSLRGSVSDAEYLIAWFVCKLGLTTNRVYNLKLSDFNINDSGRCVIRPSSIWLNLPKHIENIVQILAEKELPQWHAQPEHQRKHYYLFHNNVISLKHICTRVLQGRAKVLRMSALYAMMNNGYLDRVTLISSTGVSTPTLAKLERLFSVDVHRRLDPEFVKLRNIHITGEPNENG